jgi:hypothetical protein
VLKQMRLIHRMSVGLFLSVCGYIVILTCLIDSTGLTTVTKEILIGRSSSATRCNP